MSEKKVLGLLLVGYVPLVVMNLLINDNIYLTGVLRHVNVIYACFVGSFLYQILMQPLREKMRRHYGGKMYGNGEEWASITASATFGHSASSDNFTC